MTTAWHNDPALKADALTRLRQHRAEDSIIQNLYQELAPELKSGYRGCAIGCTLPRQQLGPDGEPQTPGVGWHGRVEQLYGIPRAVARLVDAVFEGLPASEAGDFAVSVAEAIPVGADLSLVTSRLMLDVLADDEHGAWRHTAEGSRQRAAVEAVAGLYRRRLAGDDPSKQEWHTAAADAHAAAATHAAADAAYATHAAADAAYAYADAAAYAARHDHWRWLADRLIHHLTAAAEVYA